MSGSVRGGPKRATHSGVSLEYGVVMKLTRSAKDGVFASVALLPAILIVGVCLFIPVLRTVGFSFLDYKLSRRTAGQRPLFNNFANYTRILESGELQSALMITLVFVVWVTCILLVLGMILALALGRIRRGGKLLRAVAMLPWVMPTIISALLWSWIFQPQYGALNYLLKALGILKENAAWLGDPALALPSVMVAAIWKQLPFMFLMILAGLQGIPQELHEAAIIDGANPVQDFFSVTLPGLANVLRTTVLMTVIMNFKQFPLFQLMTNGGPMNRTTNLAILSYRYAFGNLDFGTGAAVATLWLVLLILFSLGYGKIFPEGDRE